MPKPETMLTCFNCRQQIERSRGTLETGAGRFLCYSCQIVKLPNKQDQKWYQRVYCNRK